MDKDTEYKEVVSKLMKGLNQMGFQGTVIGAVALEGDNELEALEAFRLAFEASTIEGTIIEIGEEDETD